MSKVEIALPADYRERWRVAATRVGMDTMTVKLYPVWRDEADFVTEPVLVYGMLDGGKAKIAAMVYLPKQLGRMFSRIEDALAYYEANDQPPTPAD